MNDPNHPPRTDDQGPAEEPPGGRSRLGRLVDATAGGVARLDDTLRSEPPGRRVVLWLWLFFGVLILGYSIAKLPVSGRFECFFQLDYGSNLTLQDLIDAGQRPAIDFFYPYGLLPVAVGRVWFWAVGRTPWAYLALVGLMQLGVAWGLARFAVACRGGLAALMLITAAIPYAVNPTYPSLCHGLEAIFLIHALADQAAGRRPRALALATLALLSKPSMAYIYGFLLVCSIAWEHRQRPVGILRAVQPAALIGVTLSGVLAAWFSVRCLVASLLPFYIAGLYDDFDYGFFRGRGRLFWIPPGADWTYYVGTTRGFWIAATLVLLAASIVTVAWWAQGRQVGRGIGQVVVSCALLHLAFLCYFFAGEVSWLYYSNVLVLGVAALAAYGRWGRRIVLGLMILAVAADRTLPRELAIAWAEVGLAPRLEGLWTTPDDARAYRELLDRLNGRQAFLISMAGCPHRMSERFVMPADIFLVPGMGDSIDATHRAQRIASVDFVVATTPGKGDARLERLFFEQSPPIQRALKPFRLAWSNDRYAVFERVRPAGGDRD